MNRKLTRSEQELEKKRAYARAYYLAHKDKARTYYQNNKEKIKARSAMWKVLNRERYLAQQSDYDKNRRGSIKAPQWILDHNRRVREAGSTPKRRD